MTLQIWVLERSHSRWLTSSLIGDFAIRAFASFDAFWVLYSIFPEHSLQAFVVNRTQFGPDEAVAAKITFSAHNVKIPIFEVYPDKHIINGTLEIMHDQAMKSLKESIIQSAHLNFLKINPASQVPGDRESHRYKLDFDRLIVQDSVANISVSLTLKEMKILNLFLNSPQKRATRGDLLKHIWLETRVAPRTLDSHISRLRKKVEGLNIHIESNYRDGYILKSGS